MKNYHAPKFEFSTTPPSSIFRKKWKLRLWHQITLGTLSGASSGLWGPMGSKKWIKTVKNYHAPKFEFSTTPPSSFFSQKMEVTVMAPNHGGDPLGSILGPMGSHWVKKWVKTVKNYHAPKFEFSTTPLSSIFRKKMEATVLAPNHGGDTLGSIFGRMGSHWLKKWVQTVKNYHTPKVEFLTNPQSSIIFKNRSYGYGTKSRWWTPRVLLGVNRCHWVQIMGQNRKKLPCPKIRIFHYPVVIDFFAQNRSHSYCAN